MKPVSPSLLFEAVLQVFGQDFRLSGHIIGSANITTEDEQNLGGARILLVEDNPMNRQVATEVLQSAGIFVDTANNGQEAIDRVSTGDYQLVLMDVQMPVMGGYEATAVMDTIAHPLKALKTFVSGPELDAPMAPEISLEQQRPAQYVYDSNVQLTLSQMRDNETREKAATAA